MESDRHQNLLLLPNTISIECGAHTHGYPHSGWVVVQQIGFLVAKTKAKKENFQLNQLLKSVKSDERATSEDITKNRQLFRNLWQITRHDGCRQIFTHIHRYVPSHTQPCEARSPTHLTPFKDKTNKWKLLPNNPPSSFQWDLKAAAATTSYQQQS